MLPEDAYVIIFCKDQILATEKHISCIMRLQDIEAHTPLELSINNSYFIGNFENKKTYAVYLHSEIASYFGHRYIPTRELLTIIDTNLSKQVLRAKQLINWHLSSLYCGSCGSATFFSEIEISKICRTCQNTIYPSCSPAVIVLIVHEDKLLLARSPHFPEGMFSTLAGFVDAGESCEEAIHREVLEEVGIEIKNVTYFGSQPWPFPNSFMLGFKAEYHSGNLIIDGIEIEDAKWFSKDDLPILPSEYSIARQLINSFIQQI